MTVCASFALLKCVFDNIAQLQISQSKYLVYVIFRSSALFYYQNSFIHYVIILNQMSLQLRQPVSKQRTKKTHAAGEFLIRNFIVRDSANF